MENLVKLLPVIAVVALVVIIGVRRKTPAFRYGDIRRSKLRQKCGFC